MFEGGKKEGRRGKGGVVQEEKGDGDKNRDGRERRMDGESPDQSVSSDCFVQY